MQHEPQIDANRTLLELGVTPNELRTPEPGSERAVMRLWTTPLRKFSPADFLLMIGEEQGLKHLVPLAAARLREEPFLQAWRCPGDLLTCVIEVPAEFWIERRELWETVMVVLEDAMEKIAASVEENEMIRDAVGDDFAAALLHFTGLHERGTEV